MDPNPGRLIEAVIAAAVKLKLRHQIRASFFFGWGIPVALSGRALPWPYDQLFYAAGAALAILGVLVLFFVQFRDDDKK
jgi:hypothetical protein